MPDKMTQGERRGAKILERESSRITTAEHEAAHTLVALALGYETDMTIFVRTERNEEGEAWDGETNVHTKEFTGLVADEETDALEDVICYQVAGAAGSLKKGVVDLEDSYYYLEEIISYFVSLGVKKNRACQLARKGERRATAILTKYESKVMEIAKMLDEVPRGVSIHLTPDFLSS